MPPLEWDKVMAAKPSKLSDDEIEGFYEALVDFDPTEDDVAKLKQLFKVTQAIMKSRNDQVEEIMDEMEKETKQQKKKEQELIAERKELEKKVEELEKYGGDSAKGSGTARKMRDELSDLDKQNVELQQDIRDLKQELATERRTAEKYSERISDVEKEMKELREDNDQMRQDITEYKLQLQSQRNMMVAKQDDTDMASKLMRKNKDLAEAMEELQNLTDANDMLQKQTDNLNRQLEEAITQMDRTTEDYAKLKLVLQQSDTVQDRLREDNEILKSKVADLTEQLASKTDADDAIMVAVDNKIEEWKLILQDKDQSIVDQQEEIFRLREQLIAANMDSDKASVAALSKVIKEKDRQIEELTEQMKVYADDLDNNAAIIEDLRSELHRTGQGPGERQQLIIRELKEKLKGEQERNKNADRDIKLAEQDASEKDKELNDALERMRQYEAGEYGLAEAVAEIKDGKKQVKVRDRQIEELTQHINKTEMAINDLCDENEDLRGRLGLDPRKPLDLTKFRSDKAVRKEEEKAMNYILQKEVEKLEDERIELKQKIRKMAQHMGQRAVALGLTADDMIAVQEYTETLKEKRKPESVATIIKREVAMEETNMRRNEYDQDIRENFREMDRLYSDNAQLKARAEQLDEENKHLEQGLKEVMEAMKKYGVRASEDGEVIEKGERELPEMQFPALERMLAAIEAKSVIGRHDTSLFLKAQMDNLQGRNDELRMVLRETRHESNKANLELEKAMEKIKQMEEELKSVKGPGGVSAGFFKPMNLPENMATTSAEVIAGLNEHLVTVLQELHVKEELLNKTEGKLEDYKRKFAVVRHQQGLLYHDYLKDKKSWEEEVKKLKEDLKNVEGQREEDKVRNLEFDRLIDTLNQDDSEIKRRLSDLTRRITVYRVNEKALTRRYQTMEEMDGQQRKEINRLKNEMVAMEQAVVERMGYLQRYKDMAAFKIAGLQKALEDSVPTSDLDHANKKYHELTEKYRDLLEKGNNLVLKAEMLTGLEVEVKRMTVENEELKKTMTLDKEKLHTLEAALNELHRRGVTDGTEIKGITDADVITTSKKITTLEMKEMNERQRAEHAVNMYEQQKSILHGLENRNKELEDKFAEITRSNLDLQKIERDLRDELSNSVTKAVSDADRKKIDQLDEQILNLQHENSKLKEVTDVASSQVKALEMQHISKEKEVKSLRQQLLDFQVQSDEKTIIGKLHRHIVQLQVSEGTAVRKLEESRKKVTKLEAMVLRLEQKIDDKENTLFHKRKEAQNKVQYLKRNLHDMRLQFAGAIPLSKQEKFSKNLMQLQQDKAHLEDELRQVKKTKEDMEDKLAALELQHKSLQDLMTTLKDGRGAAKVKEWHGKMDTLRLEELKHRRHITKLQQQIGYLEGIIRTHESGIAELETDNVKLTQEFEERQLRWEHREVELERQIATLERQTAQIAGAAAKFEEAVGRLPDSKLPVANQLEQAISTIKSNVRIILDTQAESKRLKQRNEELEKHCREVEHALIARDKVIADLRLRMPATAERDEIILRAQSKANTEAEINKAAHDRNFESEQSMKVAQSTIASLQARIQQKEETICKYQDLLRQAREDMQDMNKRHEQELRAMQQKIHMNTDAAFSKFKEAAQQIMTQKLAHPISNKQIARLNELEDLVVEQENALAAMAQKLRSKDEDIVGHKTRLQQQLHAHAGEKQSVVGQLSEELANKQADVDRLTRTVEHQAKELELLNEELGTAKDANSRAPTTTMKNLVERLKNQLALKEKQHQALSKALTELRADMVTQAQEQVKAHTEDSSQQINVQKIVDKHTKELTDQIEDLQNTIERQKKELKKRKDKESGLHSEIDDFREELTQKEKTVHKLKGDKQRLESEIEELEKKIERMSTMKTQKTGEENTKREMDELRRQVRLLEGELKRKSQAAEKPYDHKKESPRDPPPKGTGGSEELLKWEESKKWQKTVEKMRSKIKERDAEIDKLQKSNKMLKDISDRLTREKDNLERRLSAKPTATAAAPPLTSAPYKPDHQLEKLKNQNYQLQEEVADLKRQLLVGREVPLQEERIRSQQLAEQVEIMEQVVAKKQHTTAKSPTEALGSQGSEYQVIFEKNQNLQKQVLKMSEENIELKFEAEQAKKDIPRLKDRINDLQRYVEALKSENSQLLAGDGTNRSMDSAGSSIRRIGESGKSTRQLEKTVALLKKVVERVQSENEQLKKAPGVVSNERLQNLQLENEGLKSQMEELRQKVGATLSERYTSQQKGTAKMMGDYEKMRKDLMKEMDNNEKLRAQITSLEIKLEQQKGKVAESKTRLQIEEGKTEDGQGADGKGWKSAVVTRMYEDRLKSLEAELDKKTKLLSETKTLLKEAAIREQRLMAEKEQLLKKVAVLERVPPGSSGMSDIDVARDYQQSRLTIDRLENEKKELAFELTMARRQAGAGNISEEIFTKANNYDRVMSENIELGLELKTIRLERDKTKLEVDRLRKELGTFGPDFFEEIEDLKFNYKQSVEKNILYEEKLKQVSEQFGISIPGVR
ncbi:centrosomal protein of 290 kDa-like [Mercenaria mercenaria]|uniref:centrosomal protein of 290 kDa-like n=1 Tax=Mercenaria mercenaria TaxID=6596 RepID=UPI00234EECB4|nr:centrosomal protein of 290 kDa-like [Mercenaria mercenaria]